jgi:hypothetical protein
VDLQYIEDIFQINAISSIKHQVSREWLAKIEILSFCQPINQWTSVNVIMSGQTGDYTYKTIRQEKIRREMWHNKLNHLGFLGLIRCKTCGTVPQTTCKCMYGKFQPTDDEMALFIMSDRASDYETIRREMWQHKLIDMKVPLLIQCNICGTVPYGTCKCMYGKFQPTHEELASFLMSGQTGEYEKIRYEKIRQEMWYYALNHARIPDSEDQEFPDLTQCNTCGTVPCHACKCMYAKFQPTHDEMALFIMSHQISEYEKIRRDLWQYKLIHMGFPVLTKCNVCGMLPCCTCKCAYAKFQPTHEQIALFFKKK